MENTSWMSHLPEFPTRWTGCPVSHCQLQAPAPGQAEVEIVTQDELPSWGSWVVGGFRESRKQFEICISHWTACGYCLMYFFLRLTRGQTPIKGPFAVEHALGAEELNFLPAGLVESFWPLAIDLSTPLEFRQETKQLLRCPNTWQQPYLDPW